MYLTIFENIKKIIKMGKSDIQKKHVTEFQQMTAIDTSSIFAQL